MSLACLFSLFIGMSSPNSHN